MSGGGTSTLAMFRLALAALLFAGCAGDAQPAAAPTPLQREISGLARTMEETHPDLFHDVSRARFRAEAAKLAADAPDLSRPQLVARLMRLVALPGPREGHTAIYPFDAHPRQLRIYPLRLYDFADGWHAVAVAGRPELTGKRLTSIAGRPVAEVVRLVEPLVPRDNESSRRWLLPEYLTTAEVLQGLSIAAGDAVAFGFAGGVEVTLEPQPAHDVAASVGSALTPLPAHGNPVWLRNLGEDQWLTTIASGRVVYLGYRATTGATYDLAERLLRAARRPKVRRVVVDVRLNHGGNNQTYAPLLNALSQPAISRKLVLLTGRQTFSAAGNFTADVARFTKARIVGELAGGAPSQWGDSVTVDLPLTGLVARVATKYQDFGPPGSTRPDVLVEATAADFLAGRDPVLARALALR